MCGRDPVIAQTVMTDERVLGDGESADDDDSDVTQR